MNHSLFRPLLSRLIPVFGPMFSSDRPTELRSIQGGNTALFSRWQLALVAFFALAGACAASTSASISGPSSLNTGQGGSWTFSASASGASLSRWRFYFSSNPNPQWSSVGGSSASGTYSTSFGSAGSYTMIIEAEDTGGGSSSDSITVTVTAPHVHTWVAYDNVGAWQYGTWSAWSPSWDPNSHYTYESQYQTQSRTNQRWHDRGQRCTAGDADQDLGTDGWEYGTDTNSQTIYGNITPNSPPSASISGPTNLYTGQSGSWPFSAYDSDGNLWRWRFYFSTNSNPQWTYISGSSVAGTYANAFSSPGTYTMIVDVQDTNGASDSRSVTVHVTDPVYALTVTNGSGGGSYTSGTSVGLSANTPPSGYQFNGWQKTSGPGTLWDSWSPNTATFTTGAGAATVTATYTPITQYLTVVNGTGSGYYAWGSSVYVTANAAPSGQHFTGWSVESGSASFQDASATSTNCYTGAGDMTIKANFAVTTYNVTVVGGSGSGSYAPQQSFTISANFPPNGQAFTQWNVSGAGTVQQANSSYTSFTAGVGDATVTAAYDTIYTLTMNGGTVNGAGTGYYTPGTSVTLTANAAPTGKTFAQWSLSGLGSIASATSATSSFTTGAANTTVSATYSDTTAPTAPAGLAATSVTANGFTLGWDPSTDGVGVAAYEIRRDSVSLGEVTATSTDVTSLTAGTSYSMTVRARDAAPNWSAWSTPLIVTTVPNAPTAQAATSVTSTGFTANWAAASGATGYRLDVSIDPNFGSFVGSYNSLDVGNVTSAAVVGLAAGQTYYYRIRAADAGGVSVSSSPITVAPSAPGAPVAQPATNIVGATFTANWNAVTGSTGYRLDISASSTFASFVLNNQAVGNVQSYNVTGLTAGTTYYYRVRAENGTVTSANSNVITVLATDALLDPDGDGLTNLAEQNLGTNPNVYDAGRSSLGNTIPAGWPDAGDPGNTLAVGLTRGSLSVDKNGAATYSIPIWVSPGIAGMEPKLGLNYSSQAGAGVAGFGWSLGGASAITRGPQTLAIDNQTTGVSFTYADRYYLDGQRLIAISGTDGGDGTEYRTEMDSFSRVISYGTAGNGPAYFKVWTKAGLTMEFGTTDTSAFNPGGRAEVLSWSVSKISDTTGNSMRFEYNENTTTGEHQISAIRYTERAGNDYFASVIFEYEARGDTTSGYIAGSPLATTQRLKRIKSCYNTVAGTDGTAVRTYELTYDERPNTLRSILTQVDEIAADGRKYPPLVFTYEDPASSTGWQPAPGFAPPYFLAQDGAKPRGTGFVDLDGDGRPDFILFHRWNADGGGTNAEAKPRVWLNRPSGWIEADGQHYETLPGGSQALVPDWRLKNDTADADQCVLAWDEFADFGTRFVDLDGDGRVDVIHSIKIAGVYHSTAYLNTGSGWARAPQWDLPAGAYLASEGDAKGSSRLIDINGDGRVDVVWNYDANNRGALLNTGNGWVRNDSFAPPIVIDGSVMFLDVNGDGHPDEIQYWYGGGNTVKGVALNTGSGWNLLAPGSADFNRFVPPYPITVQSPSNVYAPVGAEAVDLNGDGLVDLVWNNPAISYVGAYFNTGAGWVAAPASYIPKYKLSDNNTPVGTALIDVNGDGIVDQVVYKESVTGDAGVYLGTGRGWTDKLTDTRYNLPYFVSRYDTGKAAGMDFVDLDGDGVVDQVWNLYGGTSGSYRNNAKATDRMLGVTNGFGVSAAITYAPLTERDSTGAFTVYDKGTDFSPDTANVISPMSVVKSVTNDDGVGGQYPVAYRYAGLRTHRIHGSLGFQSMTVTDGRTNIVTKTTYGQTYPFVGMPVESTTTSGGTTLSDSTTTYADKTPANANVHVVFAQHTVTDTSDLNGAAISHADTSIPNPATDVDDYGNIKKLVVASGDTYVKTTDSQYTNDTTNWFLGRLTRSTVTSTASGTGKPQIVRTSAFVYDATTGLLTQETAEPDNAAFTLTTTYTYDAFGNKVTVALSGQSVAPRTSSTLYTSSGRFPSTATNALGHTESYTYDPTLGVVTSVTGPNGLVTSWTYDSFGLKTRESRADGTLTDYSTKWAGSGSLVPTGAKYLLEVESTGAAPALEFHDSFGRAMRSLAINGTGEIVLRDTSYDNMGRAFATSNPYRNDGQTIYWTQTTSYDLLNRPLIVQTPDDESPSGVATTTFNYSGLTTDATDANGRVTRTIKNSQGWVAQTIQNATAAANATDRSDVTYDYDVLGDIVSTNAAGVVTTLTYDLRGRKTQMVDPDMGTWSYGYNAFGELTSQTDAKNQTVTMTYDALGRLVSRTEPEGTTTWTYDTATHASPPTGAPSTWVGLLGSVAAPGGYSETYTYDSLGRVTTLARAIDGATYNISQTYDSVGRPQKTIYPTNFQTQNVYNNFGFLKEVRRADSGRNDVYWEADHYAVDGRVDGELYGNGLVNDRIYSRATGRLASANIDAGIVSGPPYVVQQLTYTHDRMGNVLTRNDGPTNRYETFGYDSLDRLTSYALTGATSLSVTTSFDPMGNIASKSDVGSYTYGTRPHAVTQAGSNTYAYDANGNMTSGAGRTLTWTSFNQLLSAVQGSFNSAFTFGAAHERVKQTSNLSTTIYVGSIFEKITTGSLVENKHYIMTPTGRVAVRTERSDASVETRYFHTDGLGSITCVTDEYGQVMKRFAFDAWGKRSNVDLGTLGTAPATSSNNGKFTRGFTDHEHLDDLGLIHMNGRVYDPVLGRFLSADPTNNEPSDPQNYNRYSYLGNNPLGGTDPSGYFNLKDGAKIAAAVVVGIVTAGVAMYGYAALIGGSFVGGFAGALSSVTLAAGWGASWAAVAGAGFGFGSAFAGSLLNGGSIGDAFKAGVVGSLEGGATAGISGALPGQGVFRSFDDVRDGFQIGGFRGAVQAAYQDATAQASMYGGRKLMASIARHEGLSLTEVNIGLTAMSFAGDYLLGEREPLGGRMNPNGSDGISGYRSRDFSRGLLFTGSAGMHDNVGMVFDTIDVALTYQGLPSSTGWKAIFSGAISNINLGHSLGASEDVTLAAWGIIGPSDAAALPFGRVAPYDVNVVNGDKDIVPGGLLSKLTNPWAKIISVPFAAHNYEQYYKSQMPPVP